MTQFPGVSIEAGAPREKLVRAPDNVRFRTLELHSCSSLLSSSFYFVSLSCATCAGSNPAENFWKKNRNLSRAKLARFPSTSSRETSSAKCPTKIGICREYRIPEVRCGLSGEVLKVLRVLLISFLFSGGSSSSSFSSLDVVASRRVSPGEHFRFFCEKRYVYSNVACSRKNASKVIESFSALQKVKKKKHRVC